MDSRILQMAVETTFCRYHDQCPGVQQRSVVNEPARGIIPRGMIVNPPDSPLDEIELVVLGQNPGQSNSFKRHLYMCLQRNESSEALYEETNQALIDSFPELPYWRNITSLLGALWPQGDAKRMLALEVAYCENAHGITDPGKATLDYCSSRHLERHLEMLRDGTFVLCVGGVAGAWFGHYGRRQKFRWFVADHLSGDWGALSRLVDRTTGNLHGPVQARWQSIVDGTSNGIHLEKADWHLRLVPAGKRKRDE